MKSWLATAFEPSVRRRALRVALVIGTVLVLINQSDAFLRGERTATMALKAALTYLVPYCVSTHASVAALRESRAGK